MKTEDKGFLKIERRHFEVIDSTQSYAVANACVSDSTWLLVTADTQTCGVGTHGRNWFSPAGGNVYATLSLKCPKVSHKSCVLPVPQVVGLSVIQALERVIEAPVSIEIALKWVNDVLINRKKVSGILCELVEGTLHIGIGININVSDFPGHLGQSVTSLFLETGMRVEVDVILKHLMDALKKNLQRLFRYGFQCFHRQIDAKIAFKGEAIVFALNPQDQRPDKRVRGVLEGIDATGALLVNLSGSKGLSLFRTGRLLLT